MEKITDKFFVHAASGIQYRKYVFRDLSTSNGNDEFNIYDDIRKKLMEKGVPAEEIAFIYDANTDIKKVELFDKVRSRRIIRFYHYSHLPAFSINNERLPQEPSGPEASQVSPVRSLSLL